MKKIVTADWFHQVVAKLQPVSGAKGLGKNSLQGGQFVRLAPANAVMDDNSTESRETTSRANEKSPPLHHWTDVLTAHLTIIIYYSDLCGCICDVCFLCLFSFFLI